MANQVEAALGDGKRLTRQRRKQLGRRIPAASPGLEVVHRDAAGIDIGSREHYVAVGPDRDSQPVRNFGCFTLKPAVGRVQGPVCPVAANTCRKIVCHPDGHLRSSWKSRQTNVKQAR